MEIKNNNKWYQSLPFSPKHSLKHKHQTQSKRRFQALFRAVGVALGRFNASLGIRRCSFCRRPLRRFDAFKTLLQALSARRCHDADWRRIETPVWRHSLVKNAVQAMENDCDVVPDTFPVMAPLMTPLPASHSKMPFWWHWNAIFRRDWRGCWSPLQALLTTVGIP